MKIVMINGQNHKGSTYHIGKMLADRLGGELKEFFLPRDFSPYCVGCNQCFLTGKEKCPHYDAQQEILQAIDEADVILLTSPVYVYHVTAPMKNFLDHQGHRWMVHRPNPAMFTKQAVCISTAAGGGMKSTNKDMADSLYYWGVARVYKIGIAVRAVNWTAVTEKKMAKIESAVSKVSAKILQREGRVKPCIKTKSLFYIMRMLQKRIGLSEPDKKYWDAMGWTGKKRPWKNS